MDAGTSRGNANVKAITAAVFDLEGPDHLPLSDEQISAIVASLRGVRAVVHSTHTAGCYRLIVALSRPALPQEWGFLWRALFSRFNLQGVADESTKDLARLFFFPTTPKGRQFIGLECPGEPVDVDAELLNAPPAEAPAPRAAPAPLTDSAPIDLYEVRGVLRAARSPKTRDLRDALVNGTALASPGSRGSTLNRAMSSLAFLGTKPFTWDEVSPLVAASIRAMDCEPEGFDKHFNDAAAQYARALSRRVTEDAKRAAVKAEHDAAKTVQQAEHAADWHSMLDTTVDKDGEPNGLQSSDSNLEVIFANDPETRGIRFNTLGGRVDLSNTCFANVSPQVLKTEVRIWLQRHPVYRSMKKLQTMNPIEPLEAVASRNRFNPVTEYLGGLAWDGVPRIGSWLVDYCGAEDNTINRAYARKWLIAAVARAMRPGCDVHSVLVLQGEQGVGKSTAFKVLGGSWFSDSPVAIGEKDGMQIVHSAWIFELAELASLSKADANKAKAFFTSREDTFRPPFGRVAETFQRPSVFAGTVNDDEILTDPTGSRRFWVVPVLGKMDTAGLRAVRDQLWAEAAAAFTKGEQWWLSETEIPLAVIANEYHTEEDPLADIIAEWFQVKSAATRPTSITTRQLWQATGDRAHASDFTPIVQRRYARALRALGFGKSKTFREGARTFRAYPTPANLLTSETETVRLVRENSDAAIDSEPASS